MTSGLIERFEKFGFSVVMFARSLGLDTVSCPVVSQLVRAATSVGVNYVEAQNAISKKDFHHKVFIAKKEAAETQYWCKMLVTYYPQFKTKIHTYFTEAEEITKILGKITSNYP